MKRLVLFLMRALFACACIWLFVSTVFAVQTPVASTGESSPVRMQELMTKYLPPKMINEHPALSIGLLWFLSSGLDTGTITSEIDVKANTIHGKLLGGGDARWVCPANDVDSTPEDIPRYTLKCTFSTDEMPPTSTFVHVKRDGAGTAVGVSFSSDPADKPFMFIGTMLPRFTPSWVPAIDGKYIDSVIQTMLALDLPSGGPNLKTVTTGRFVFDSPFPPATVLHDLREQLESEGFDMSMSDSSKNFLTMRQRDKDITEIVRIDVIEQPHQKSRCEFSFAQLVGANN